MQKQNRFIENIACYTLNEAGNCLIGLVDLNGELRAFTINGADARKIHRMRVTWEEKEEGFAF